MLKYRDIERWTKESIKIKKLLKWWGKKEQETKAKKGVSEAGYLHALSFFTGEWRFHHAVVLPQLPWLVYELHIVAPRRRDAMRRQRLFPGRLRSPFGVVDVKDHVSFTHIEVPGDHRRGVDDLDQQLDEPAEDTKRLIR